METLDDARALAELMVAIGQRAGRQVVALITQMEQPLGRAIGNTLEVQEAIAALHGQAPADFQTLVEAVAVEMLRLGSPDRETLGAAQAAARVREVIASGAALAKFRQFVVAQGGDGGQVDDPARLPAAPVQIAIPATGGGTVQRVDARELGLVAVDLGGGRQKKGDPIDHRVGLVLHAKVGARLQPGAPLCTLHAADEVTGAALRKRVQAAFHLADTPVEPLPIVYERVAASYQGV